MSVISLIADSFIETFVGLSQVLGIMGTVFSHTWFIILPIAFYYVFKILWMDYVAGKFWGSMQWTLLEIIPPREIEKSPQPMESFFGGLAGVYRGFTVFHEYLQGMSTLNFSLEIVSDAGNVHFYIRAPKSTESLVEAHLYAQYPDVEIIRVPDYIDDVPKVVPNRDWDLWGTDFELVRPDPYPIRSYRWFKEDITGEMIDPLSAVVEAMGKVGPNQKAWLQFIITPLSESWYNTGRELVEEIAGRAKKKPKGVFMGALADIGDVFKNIIPGIFNPIEFEVKGEEQEERIPLSERLTPGELDALKAIEGAIGKNVFSTKMRFVYLGKKESFDKTMVSSMMGAVKQFSDQNLNGFKPNDISKTYADYLFADARLRYRQFKIFRRYKDRDGSGKQFILNTEELATVYHLPDMSVVAPSIRRVEAKRGGAPSNLPI